MSERKDVRIGMAPDVRKAFDEDVKFYLQKAAKRESEIEEKYAEIVKELQNQWELSYERRQYCYEQLHKRNLELKESRNRMNGERHELWAKYGVLPEDKEKPE